MKNLNVHISEFGYVKCLMKCLIREYRECFINIAKCKILQILRNIPCLFIDWMNINMYENCSINWIIVTVDTL